MRTIPPEAYTHKELAHAMQWRESQPEYVKAMTNSPESLISLYKKAQRTNPGEGANSRMSESFRSDLKSLAEGLKDFEGSESGSMHIPPPSQPSQQMPRSPQSAPAQSIPNPVADTMASANRSTHEPRARADQRTDQLRDQRVEQKLGQRLNQGMDYRFDTQTQAMIQEVKNGFNLGSDGEALRLLVKVGFEKTKILLPPLTI